MDTVGYAIVDTFRTGVEMVRTGDKSYEIRFDEPWELQGIGETMAGEFNNYFRNEEMSAGVVFVTKPKQNNLF